MNIGSLGDVVFTVTDQTVRTFDEFVHTVSARLAVHETILSHPRTEYLGPGQGEITFKMQISARLVPDPRGEVEQLQQMAEQGTYAPLILGGKPVGGGDWTIETCEAAFTAIDGKGKVLFAEVTLTIKDYY